MCLYMLKLCKSKRENREKKIVKKENKLRCIDENKQKNMKMIQTECFSVVVVDGRCVVNFCCGCIKRLDDDDDEI